MGVRSQSVSPSVVCCARIMSRMHRGLVEFAASRVLTERVQAARTPLQSQSPVGCFSVAGHHSNYRLAWRDPGSPC